VAHVSLVQMLHQALPGGIGPGGIGLGRGSLLHAGYRGVKALEREHLGVIERPVRGCEEGDDSALPQRVAVRPQEQLERAVLGVGHAGKIHDEVLADLCGEDSADTPDGLWHRDES
jgi:hypothetical protein